MSDAVAFRIQKIQGVCSLESTLLILGFFSLIKAQNIRYASGYISTKLVLITNSY